MNDGWDNMTNEEMLKATSGSDCGTESICPDCGEPWEIVPLDNSFDYSGTHCTFGNSGTHYPDDYGRPVSDCCDAEMEVD